MSNLDARTALLYAGLTVSERTQLILRNFKEDKKQNHDLVRMAPERQTRELNRLIGLMNAANGDLAHLIAIIGERAEKETLRFGWLEWARLCALEMWAVRAHFNISSTEPITESVWKEKEQAARAELLSLDDCAAIATEDFHVWNEPDYETDEDGDRVPTDDAWYRERDRVLKELRALVEAGTLASSGKGKRMKIACGSFYDWLGRPVPVPPDFGLEYDVLPDHRQPEVERRLRDHALIRHLLDRGALDLELPLDTEAPLSFDTPVTGFDTEMARVLAVALRTAVQENWRELRAIEEQVESISGTFQGEDVLHPRVRLSFDEAKTSLTKLHEDLQRYTGAFALPEADEDLRGRLESIVEREAQNVPVR